MTSVKNEVFIGLLHADCYLVWGLTFGEGGGDKNLVGGNFFRQEKMSKCLALGGNSPSYPPSREKPDRGQ